jgi:hypothetical protein
VLQPIVEEKKEDVFEDDPNLGIYLIDYGTCNLTHRYDGFNCRELRRWDFFGECDLLKVIGYTYFGDIVAVSDEVRTLFISNAKFKKIPVYEQLVMKQYCQARQDIAQLSYMFSTRFNIDIKEYSNYY